MNINNSVNNVTVITTLFLVITSFKKCCMYITGTIIVSCMYQAEENGE